MSTTPVTWNEDVYQAARAKWSDEEIDMIHRFKQRGWTNEMSAGRFSHRTAADVQLALDTASARERPAAVSPVPKSEAELLAASAEALKSMDPLQKLFMDHVKQYNRLGESLSVMSHVISLNVDLPQLQKQAKQIETLWGQLVMPDGKEKATLSAFLVRVLHENFIIVPRPVLQHKSNAQPTDQS